MKENFKTNKSTIDNFTTITKKGIDLTKIKFNDKGLVNIQQNPQLKNGIVGLRPSHKSGLPVVKAEIKNEKYISHNYCHSGIGYSIMFGTINQSIDNLLNLKKDLLTNKNQEITVIGLGCIGLYTVLKLHYLGYTNVKIIGEKFDETPSIYAGGLMEISLMKDIDADYMNKIFYETFIEYKKIYENNHEILNKGIRFVDYFTDEFNDKMGISYIEHKGLIPKVNKVFLEFDTNKNLKLPVYHFKTFHIVTIEFMDHMMNKAKEFKIPIEFRKIKNFEEVNSEIIFNCTGLGSRELNNDSDCYPIAGHGINLNNEEYSKHDFIIRLENVEKLENDHPINGPLYFMPKNTGFIGGTYMPYYDGENKEKNDLEFSKLVKRAQYFFNDIKAMPKF